MQADLMKPEPIEDESPTMMIPILKSNFDFESDKILSMTENDKYMNAKFINVSEE